MQPKNLLFILSDEHNRDFLGCYGHPIVKTPQLDALAQRGTRFNAAYTNCPICVPARASLATGRHVNEIGFWDNAFPYDGRVKGWGHRLQAEGHRVDSIGKLHYRSEEDDDGFSNKYIPLNVVDGVGDVMGSIRDDLPTRTGTRNGVIEAGPGDSTYLRYDVEIAERACDWLQQFGAQQGRPWVLFVSFVCPHPPFIAPPELFAQYPLEEMVLPIQNVPGARPQHAALDRLRRAMEYETEFEEQQIRQVIAAYCGCCTHLDNQIGRVLKTLGDCGLEDSTRILYTSDHGESMGSRGLWGKFTMYEESAAIPLILAGPDVPEGTVCDDPVSLVDCYQTTLDCLGVPLDEQEQQLPGNSLWPVAQGEVLGRSVLSEYHAVASQSAWYMLRRDNFKYIYYVGERAQLFNLSEDPTEVNDLALDPQYAPKLAEMEQLLRAIVDPEEADRRAKKDQETLVDSYGGKEAVLRRGTFVNSPVPGETPKFTGE